MKILCLSSLFFLGTLSLQADEVLTYSERLKEASQAIYHEEFENAKTQFTEAHKIATTNTERALALAKYSHMLAYKQKDYDQAMEQAEKGLEYKDIKPVAKVTLLQVKAKCLMQEEDYEEAAKVVKEALELENVEWARPPLYLSLGDCHRFTGEPEKAIEAFGKVPELEKASSSVIAVAYLNQGMTYQYNLRDEAAARKAYAKVKDVSENFNSVIDEHLSKF